MDLESTEISSCADFQEVGASESSANQEEVSTQESFNNNTEKELSAEIGNEIDQKLYDEVLEKLDIVKKTQNKDIQDQINQRATLHEKLKNETHQSPKIEKSQEQLQIENTLVRDFTKLQKLMQAGLINSGQEQNLKNQVLKKAFDKLVQIEKIKRTAPEQLSKVTEVATNTNEVFEEFSKSNPEFFVPDGRKEVLNYLKADGVTIGKDELNKISDIVRVVEKSAIDRYLKKAAYEKTLRDSNEISKQRLTANAQKTSFGGSFLRNFTREQIGKMSSAEFIKYEPVIMEQLKKGLIR